MTGGLLIIGGGIQGMIPPSLQRRPESETHLASSDMPWSTVSVDPQPDQRPIALTGMFDQPVFPTGGFSHVD